MIAHIMMTALRDMDVSTDIVKNVNAILTGIVIHVNALKGSAKGSFVKLQVCALLTCTATKTCVKCFLDVPRILHALWVSSVEIVNALKLVNHSETVILVIVVRTMFV